LVRKQETDKVIRLIEMYSPPLSFEGDSGEMHDPHRTPLIWWSTGIW